MNKKEEQLRLFFDAYAASFNAALSGEDSDADAAATAFAAYYLEVRQMGNPFNKNEEAIPRLLPIQLRSADSDKRQ